MAVKPKTSIERQFAAGVKLAQRWFPGIEVETSYGTPALKVYGKFLARLRTEAEGWLAIRCDYVDREILLQSAPHIFHLTPHYENYPMILVDLGAIDDGALLEVLERAWRKVAPKRAIRAFDEEGGPPGGKRASVKKRPAKKRPAKKRSAKKR